MQIDKKYRIEHCVSKDSTREQMNNIFVNKTHAMATNGHILARVPIELEKGDTEGCLSPEALKLARKVTPKNLGFAQIVLNGSQVMPDGTAMTRPTATPPPQTEKIVNEADAGKKFTVALDASYLKDIADALGSDRLVMSFGTPTSAILIRPFEGDEGALGLLMPIRIK